MEHYGHDDIVGCGLDVQKEAIFFTKNGVLLDFERQHKPTHLIHTGVTGRLYPAVGLDTIGVKLKLNLGNDLKSRPFCWGPGNEADNGISFVAEKEEILARRPLRRRTTSAFHELQVAGGASDDSTVGADATAGAEAQVVASAQANSVEVAAAA